VVSDGFVSKARFMPEMVERSIGSLPQATRNNDKQTRKEKRKMAM
jgi:hypothetical protein